MRQIRTDYLGCRIHTRVGDGASSIEYGGAVYSVVPELVTSK